ncbi:MAG: glycosyltransferase [Burkholderiales bacterium]|nr:glycosyltransferase [Burkholderiales bacterium]
MSKVADLNVLLVDPSLFTAPYDAALSEGLVAAGVSPMWATRPTRKGDRQELPIEQTYPFFYRRVDEATWIPGKLKAVAKGIAHAAGLATLLWKIKTTRPDVVHVQWIVVPPLDALAMTLFRRMCPLVLTVHDTVPFNGQNMSWMQRYGHDQPTKIAHRVVVHTQSGKQALVARGVDAHKIAVIPHGPLRLAVQAPPRPESAVRDARWTFVLFGEIKPYKGFDILIDAVHCLPEAVRQQMRVIVAGRPRMDIAPLLARVTELGLDAQFDLRLQRQSEEEMAVLFDDADCFVFPYRQIDASGVYFLVKPLGKWLIASHVGIFAEDMVPDLDGALVPSNDAAALAEEMHLAIVQKSRRAPMEISGSWQGIGHTTRELYEQAMRDYGGEPVPQPRNVLE